MVLVCAIGLLLPCSLRKTDSEEWGREAIVTGMEKNTFDLILVGSGINSLVVAAMVARMGRKVLVLEREDTLGGCIRTDALTLPGFLHDTLSTAHPLFLAGPAYAALGKDLHAAGLQYCNNSTPAGVVLPDGRSLVLRTSRQENIARFDAECPGAGAIYQRAMQDVEQNAELIFTLVGNELWRWSTAKTVGRAAWRMGVSGVSEFSGQAMEPARAWLHNSFDALGPQAASISALLAPWVLHTGLGPDAPVSALMNKVVALTLETVGMPLVQGGNAQFVQAFVKLISSYGGQLRTHAHVQQVLVENGRVCGVRLSGDETILSEHVACSVTPAQLYQQLLPAEVVPESVRQQAKQFRHGKGNMQIHVALSAAPQWRGHPELAQTTYVHLTSGAQAVSTAVNQAENGWLPAKPTVCVAQPTALDPSRAPAGQHVLWIQVPECPRTVVGDAAGQIAAPADGSWSTEVRESFADRVMALVAQHIPNLHDITLARRVLGPADLEAINCNLVGGDPYGGDCSLDQSFLWRPMRALRNHTTPVQNLWHIGASTHPGPGLGGGSGYHLAQLLGAT